MNIIAFGDIHFKYECIGKIPELSAADLIIITGDLTIFGNRHDAEVVINKVRSYNKNIMAVQGNLDNTDVIEYLDEIDVSLHGRGRFVNNLGIFGVGGSNPTPFNAPSEYAEDEICKIAQEAYKNVKGSQLLIFVSHAPPFNTKTDQIDNNIHVGSSSIRDFIASNQPDLCLTGHIHEAKAVDWIGKTKILNPGMLELGTYIQIKTYENKIEADLKSFL